MLQAHPCRRPSPRLGWRFVAWWRKARRMPRGESNAQAGGPLSSFDDGWTYSILGLCVGFLVGMTGVSGGSLMTPALVPLFGIHPATAVGTDLLFARLTKSVGTGVH